MAIRLIALLSAGLFPLTAMASDYGTYRAGGTYMSVPATSPDQCISQCQGDAQCKGWNFVQISADRMICEFNSRQVPPMASNISISGDNASNMDNHRLIPGGHRTTRVGQMPQMVQRPGSLTRVGSVPPPRVGANPAPRASIVSPHQPRMAYAAPRPQPAYQAQPIPQSQPTRSASRRTSRRMQTGPRRSPALPNVPYVRPIPQAPQQSTAYGAAPAAPAFRPQLETAQQNQGFEPSYAPQPDTSPRFQPQLDGMMPPPDMAPQPSLPQPSMDHTMAHNQAPMPPQDPYAYEQRPSISEAPSDYEPPVIRAEDVPGMIRPPAMPDPSMDLAGGPIAGNLPPGNSLYGSLYDDVRAPRSLGAGDIPADPNAPISTVVSVPVR